MNAMVASYVNCGMCLSYPVDSLAEPIPLSRFFLFFSLLPWGAFSIYGLLAFSLLNKGLRMLLQISKDSHQLWECQQLVTCFHCLTIQRKVNLIEVWSRTFFFCTASSKGEIILPCDYSCCQGNILFSYKEISFFNQILSYQPHIFSQKRTDGKG